MRGGGGRSVRPRARDGIPGHAPNLEVLRAQLGDAMLAARIEEARWREQVVKRLEAQLADGTAFEVAARRLGERVTSATLRRWLLRWRAYGVAGLVDPRLGPIRYAKGDAPRVLRRRPSSPSARLAAPDTIGRRPAPAARTAGSQACSSGPGASFRSSSACWRWRPRPSDATTSPSSGAALFFFALQPARAFLGDRNAELVSRTGGPGRARSPHRGAQCTPQHAPSTTRRCEVSIRTPSRPWSARRERCS